MIIVSLAACGMYHWEPTFAFIIAATHAGGCARRRSGPGKTALTCKERESRDGCEECAAIMQRKAFTAPEADPRPAGIVENNLESSMLRRTRCFCNAQLVWFGKSLHYPYTGFSKLLHARSYKTNRLLMSIIRAAPITLQDCHNSLQERPPQIFFIRQVKGVS